MRLDLALFAHLRTLAVALAVAAPCWLAGDALWPWFRPARRTAALRPFAAYPLGFAALSTLLLGLLLVNLWFAAVLIGVPALLSVRARRRGWSRRLWSLLPDLADGPGRLACGLFLLLVPFALTPVTQTDGWEYFLAGPERWLARHGHSTTLVTGPVLFPFLCELPNVYALLGGTDAAVKWLEAFGLLSGFAAAVRVLAPAAGGWPWLVLAGSMNGTFLLVSGKNEGLLAGWLLLSFALGRTASRSRGAMTLAGVLAGCALAGKYLSGLNAVWIPVALWWSGAGVAMLVRWAVCALPPFLPWAARAWFVTGDPLFPFIGGTWPGLVAGLDARHAAVWRLTQDAPAGVARLTRLPGALWREHAGAALVAAWLVFRGGPARRLILPVTLVLATWWSAFPTPQTERWSFPAGVVLLVVAGAALAEAARGQRIARRWRGAAAVAAWALVLGPPVHAFRRVALEPAPWRFLVGLESAADVRAGAMTWLAEVRRWVTDHPAPGAILLTGEMREYGFPKPCWNAGQHADGRAPFVWRLTREAADEPALVRRLRQLRIVRLVHNPLLGMNNAPYYVPFPWDERELRLWAAVVGRRFELERPAPGADWRTGLFAVYRLRPTPRAAAPALLDFLPGAETALHPVITLARRHDWRDEAERRQAWRAVLAGCRDRFRTWPRVAEFLDLGAAAAVEAGDLPQAFAWYREGFAAGHVGVSNAYGFADTAYALGRWADAARGYERAAGLYPAWHARCLVRLAECRVRAARIGVP